MLEIAAGLLVGGFFVWGRAEALIFFLFRPWLLLLAALGLAPWRWLSRFIFYVLALGLAGVSESLLLIGLGGEPWIEMLRGWAAGALGAAVIDFIIQLGFRRGCLGQTLATALVLLLLLVPGGQLVYEAIAIGPSAARPQTERPPLLLMSGLPLVWGEGGPFDPASQPAAAYQALEREFDVRPIDYLDPRNLAGARLLLLAQPRALTPQELVALDHWVGAGGHVLVLADPQLEWPSRLPFGDVRRPPSTSLLAPLLRHWGLRLEPRRRGILVDHLRDGPRLRRLALDTPGAIRVEGPACRTGARDYLAFCVIGRGRAVLVGDADLLRDDLWSAPGPRGAERHRRLADNPLLVARWLDRLAGLDRPRSDRQVFWQRPHANRPFALMLAALPILAALGWAGLSRRRHG